MQTHHQNCPTSMKKSKILRTSCAQVFISLEFNAPYSHIHDLQVFLGTCYHFEEVKLISEYHVSYWNVSRQ